MCSDADVAAEPSLATPGSLPERRRKRFVDRFPRLDRSRPGLDLDPALPAMVLWVGASPLQHGSLGVFRSLGRAGVPVYTVVGARFAPTVARMSSNCSTGSSTSDGAWAGGR